MIVPVAMPHLGYRRPGSNGGSGQFDLRPSRSASYALETQKTYTEDDIMKY